MSDHSLLTTLKDAVTSAGYTIVAEDSGASATSYEDEMFVAAKDGQAYFVTARRQP